MTGSQKGPARYKMHFRLLSSPWTRALLGAAAWGAASAAFAWVYPEHRDIAVLAVQGLEARQGAAFGLLWQEARGGRREPGTVRVRISPAVTAPISDAQPVTVTAADTVTDVLRSAHHLPLDPWRTYDQRPSRAAATHLRVQLLLSRASRRRR